MKFRSEKDFLGTVRVPADAYYGAETERAKENFPISGIRIQKTFIRHYAIIKRSAALANMKLGKLDPKIGNAIVKAADEVIAGKFDDQFVVDIYQSGAGTSVNMNVNEVIANRALEMLKKKRGDYKIINPNDHVNMSQSTNDTFPSAIRLSVYNEVTKVLVPELERLATALEKKSTEFKDTIKVGRTHLQDAVPMTLGQEISGYSVSLRKHISNIQKSVYTMLYLPLGGTAVGTGIEASSTYSRTVIDEISKYTKVDFKVAKNFFDIQQNRDEEGWVSSSLRDLAIALNKIANDLRLMASGPSAGFGDLILPAVQPGSSIMPGKVNPSMPEMLNMVCFEVIGNDTAIAHAIEGGQLELNIYMPIIAYNLLYSIDILSNGVGMFTKKCVAGIKANAERMKSGVERDYSIATALAPYIGYAKAAKIARLAFKKGRAVKQIALEMRIMPKTELEKILNPKRMVKKKR